MALVALGLVLAVAGALLLLDVAGLGGAVIRRVTSRSLGSLAPGYAATQGGFRVYAGLLVALGVGAVAAGLLPSAPLVGLAGLALAGAAFLGGSVAAIAGEARVYRRLARGGSADAE